MVFTLQNLHFLGRDQCSAGDDSPPGMRTAGGIQRAVGVLAHANESNSCLGADTNLNWKGKAVRQSTW